MIAAWIGTGALVVGMKVVASLTECTRRTLSAHSTAVLLVLGQGSTEMRESLLAHSMRTIEFQLVLLNKTARYLEAVETAMLAVTGVTSVLLLHAAGASAVGDFAGIAASYRPVVLKPHEGPAAKTQQLVNADSLVPEN